MLWETEESAGVFPCATTMTPMPVNRTTLVRSGIVLGAILAVSGGAWLGIATFGGPDEPQKEPARTPKGFGTLRHPSSGFSLQYPRSWEQFDPKDPPREVPLVAGPGGDDFVLVRLCRLPEEIPREAVPGLRPGFDSIIQGGKANILEQKQITLNRLPGFHYLYTFLDEQTQQQGVHSHYFLVDKATVFQLVFQALPVEDFRGLSRTFDQIANSFRVIPRTGSVAPCSSSASETPEGQQAPPATPPA